MKRKIYGLILSALALSVGFSSCLKDENIDNQDYGLINLNAKKIIEIPSDASHELSLTLLPEGVKEITIGEIRLAAEKPAAEDIVVNLTKDVAGVFDEDQAIFPLDQIEIPASVTIKKGDRSAALVIKINTAFLQSEPQYFPVSIKSVNQTGYTISGNFGVLKVNAKVKHKYQGRYVCTGTMTDVTNAAFIHASIELTNEGEDYIIDLETVDGSTLVIGESPTFGGANKYYFWAGTGFSYYGSFCPQFTFDNAGNVTAVTNAYGQPASNTRSAQIDPSGVNKYNPATKSFTVSYWMNQPSVVATPPNHRVSITETYTFKEDF